MKECYNLCENKAVVELSLGSGVESGWQLGHMLSHQEWDGISECLETPF